MKQTKETKETGKPSDKGIQSLVMMLIVWAVIELDALCLLIPNQIAAFAVTPVLWGIGASIILVRMKRKNRQDLYATAPLTGSDALILFFVITAGISLAASNYLYAGLKPLFIRELFTPYPLYTIRNIIYYPLEVLLMLELLIYSQKAGESFTGKTAVPWGALALFLLWGTPHLIHGFSDGIVSALRAFIYAIPFYASRKNIKTSYISMLILWFL